MKKFFLLFTLGYLQMVPVISQKFTINIKNSTSGDLECNTIYQHGTGFVSPVIPKGATTQILYMTTASAVFTGVEGELLINPLGDKNAVVAIFYNNPCIGKSGYSFSAPGYSGTVLAFTSVSWLNEVHNLNVELVNPNGTKAIPVTPVVQNKNGTIRGTILWNKKDILSPEIYPYGKAFSFDILAPAQFVESAGPFTFEKAGKYNGKSGYFQAFKPAGEASFVTAASYDPDYVEVRYTVTGVPTDLPLEIDITTDYDKSKWLPGIQKPKPGDDYTFLVGTFPSTSKSSVKLENNSPVLGDVDFNCEGEWVKVDGNGNIIGGGDMVNKIAARKSAPVLPEALLSLTATTRTNATMVMQPAATQNNQVQTKQVQGAVQKVRTRN